MAESQKLFPIHYARWGNLATIGMSWYGIPGFMISGVNCYAGDEFGNRENHPSDVMNSDSIGK
jgi:hypothetical protein